MVGTYRDGINLKTNPPPAHRNTNVRFNCISKITCDTSCKQHHVTLIMPTRCESK